MNDRLVLFISYFISLLLGLNFLWNILWCGLSPWVCDEPFPRSISRARWLPHCPSWGWRYWGSTLNPLEAQTSSMGKSVPCGQNIWPMEDRSQWIYSFSGYTALRWSSSYTSLKTNMRMSNQYHSIHRSDRSIKHSLIWLFPPALAHFCFSSLLLPYIILPKKVAAPRLCLGLCFLGNIKLKHIMRDT